MARALRDALRTSPRCLDCGRELEWSYGSDELGCAGCEQTLPYRIWRRRLKGRTRLPCPTCGERRSAPVRRPRSASPGVPAAREAPAGDVVACERCGWQGRWEWFRRTWRGAALLTGAGTEVCRSFRTKWSRSRSARQQMLLIDAFIYELHFGPLAPLFISGGRDSVLALLDELARPT